MCEQALKVLPHIYSNHSLLQLILIRTTPKPGGQLICEIPVFTGAQVEVVHIVGLYLLKPLLQSDRHPITL